MPECAMGAAHARKTRGEGVGEKNTDHSILWPCATHPNIDECAHDSQHECLEGRADVRILSSHSHRPEVGAKVELDGGRP